MKKLIVTLNKVDELVDMNEAEIAAKTVTEAIELTEKPLNDWKKEISENDLTSRDIENIIDVLSPEQLGALDQVTKDKHANKKEIRSRKPVEG